MIEKASLREWESWQEIVKLTKEMGCITAEDWNTHVGDCSHPTSGGALIRAIKDWGNALVEFSKERAKHA